MMAIPVRSRERAAGVLAAMVLATAVWACESQSVFEGPPTVAPPVAEFDPDATAASAIHGGLLAIGVTAHDPYVGVDSVMVRYSGALQGSFTRRYNGAPKQVRVDTALRVPFGTQGPVLLETFALNRYGSTARIDSAVATIVRQDTVRPTVTLQSAVLPQRAELSGTVSFTVSAQDDAAGGGLSRLGVAVLTAGGLVVESAEVDTRSATRDIVLQVARLTATAPAALSLQYYAWAADKAGNCTAAVAGGGTVACTYTNGTLSIPPSAGAQAALVVTATSTAAAVASSGAGVGDLVIDVARQLVYVSNQATNAVDAYSWATSSLNRAARAYVGAAPQGMTLENGGGRLIVANSGGTSLSYVQLGNDFRETSRYETPNAVLYQVTAGFGIDTVTVPDGDSLVTVVDTVNTITTEHTDFADRPQYVAQDAAGVIFFSTVPTGTAGRAAVRRVEQAPGWNEPEAGIMLWTQVVKENSWGPGSPPAPCYEPGDNGLLVNKLPCVIAYVDSMRVVYESPFLGTTWDVWDHVPGHPDQIIHKRSSKLAEIDQTLRQAGSDAFVHYGSWDLDYWLTDSERTFLTSSGNRSWVAFGEAGPPARVWNWGAAGNPARLYDRFISSFVNIEDWTNNTATDIRGISANMAGSVYATRGAQGIYFFTNPLRLLGSYANADIAGGEGIAVHPDAAGGGAASNPGTDWAAVGTPQAEIALIDTRNFRRVGTIPLLEPVGGPLRVTGRIAADPGNVVAHLFGVTRSGAVFHVAVRSSDINP